MSANHLGNAISSASPHKYALCNSAANFDYFTSGLSPGAGITLPRHNVAGGHWQTSMRGTLYNSSIPYTSAMSVEMVINTDESAYNFFGSPYAHGIVGGSGYLWAWNICIEPNTHSASDVNGLVRFQTWDINNTYQSIDSFIVTDGLNHHVAVTSRASGGTSSLYVDGVLVAVGGVYRRGDMDASTFSVGDDGSYGGLSYRDYVSHVALYNRLLTSTEIAQRAALIDMQNAGVMYDGTNWRSVNVANDTGGSQPQYGKVYNGSSFAKNTVKIWNGSAWVRA